MPQRRRSLSEDCLTGRLVQSQFVGEKPQVLRVRRWLTGRIFAPQLARKVAAPHAALGSERLDHLPARLMQVAERIFFCGPRRYERKLGVYVWVFSKPSGRGQGLPQVPGCQVQRVVE